MGSRGSETVRQRREAVEDDFGNPAASGEPIEHRGCAVYPRGASSEDTGREKTVLDGYTLLIPGKVSVSPQDEFEWAEEPGVWRKVVGKPGLWKSLQGDVLGTQVNVKGATG